MIDPADPHEVQITKQRKIIDALMRRASRQHDVASDAFAAFRSAVSLQGEVWAKTRDLEAALDTLGRASTELEAARRERERTRQNLADALTVFEGGFALFTEGRLQVFNELFQNLLPDIAQLIEPDLPLSSYFAAVAKSVHFVGPAERIALLAERGMDEALQPPVSVLLELGGDRWFKFGMQHTGHGNVAVQLIEVTGIVRANRHERHKLIEMQVGYLQATFDQIGIGIATFSREGLLMIYNERFSTLLALPYGLLEKGTALNQVLSHIQRSRLWSGLDPSESDVWRRQILRTGRLDKRLRRKGGGAVLDLSVDRLPDGGLLVTGTDVTLETHATEMLEQRVRERTSELTEANRMLRAQSARQADVEEELRLAKEQAEAAVRSKTRFLAAASHDLLQPINAAKLLISTLVEQARGTRLAPTIERLDSSFASTETLLHALLDISRLDSSSTRLTPTTVRLDQILRSISEDHAPVAERKGIRLVVVPSTLCVRSDPHYLMRSVQNLVVNAIEYTERGRVLVGCRRRGGSVVLEVWDTGIGISRKDRSAIFQEFARGGNVEGRSGVGLGLSIVERTCRHLGHAVRLRSKLGVGSVFSLEMERAAPVAQTHHDGPSAARFPEEALDLIIVLVENDPDVLYATTQRLEAWGTSVLAAHSTAEATEMVSDLGMAPDIILADYQLDGSDDGIAAIEAIRRRSGSDVPAIMITANRNEELASAGAQKGFSVLTKPVQPSRLRALIEAKTRAHSLPIDQSIA